MPILNVAAKRNFRADIGTLKEEIFLPNDIVMKSATIEDYMFLLARGTVAVYTTSGKEV